MGRLSLGILLAISAALPAVGAELQLRTRCRPRGAVVTLGDVAEVLAADSGQAEALAGVELFPAPAPGQQRTVRARELQDLLATRPVNLAEHRFSGSSQVVVESPGESARTGQQTPLSPSMQKKAERLVSEAIVAWLRQGVSADTSWDVEVTLTDAQTRAIPTDARKVVARSTAPPRAGSQQFEVTVDAPSGPVRFAVAAEVSRQQPVVVAAAALSRGAVIRAADVQLVSASAVAPRADAIRSLDDVVGRETTRAVAAGTVLQTSSVRSPLVIRRGEVITVYSRSAGIRIRTTGRAREDGSLGDLISVESLLDRKVYSARVSGIQEAEVYARAMRPAAAGDSSLGRGAP